MGGHHAGEVASRMAVEMLADGIAEALPELHRRARKLSEKRSMAQEVICRWTQEANAAIHRRGQREGAADDEGSVSGKSQMGTTLALVLFVSDFGVVANVGDSRVYRIRDGEIDCLTEDHTIVAETKRHPADPRPPRKRKYVTRALGTKPKVKPDVSLVDPEDGDLFLLCSDGLTDVVTDDEIVDVLERKAPDWRAAIRRLIQLANARGGPDNITVVLAEVFGAGDDEDDDDDTDELEIWQR
jgi:protein phosphatase